ncbi:hypothetical protein V1511DRAFT_278409 [Dipodascopsis uninucleata]
MFINRSEDSMHRSIRSNGFAGMGHIGKSVRKLSSVSEDNIGPKGSKWSEKYSTPRKKSPLSTPQLPTEDSRILRLESLIKLKEYFEPSNKRSRGQTANSDGADNGETAKPSKSAGITGRETAGSFLSSEIPELETIGDDEIYWRQVQAKMKALNSGGQSKEVFQLANQVATNGKVPPMDIYSEILMAMTNVQQVSMGPPAMELVEEIIAHYQTVPLFVFEKLFKLIGQSPDAIMRSKLLDLAIKYEYNINERGWQSYIQSCLISGELEVALDTLDRVRSHGLFCPATLYDSLVHQLVHLNELEVAFKVFKDALEVHRSLPTLTWNLLLSVAAREFNYDILKWTWENGVDTSFIEPDDGTCENSILTATRNNDPSLGIKALRFLIARKSKISEHLLSTIVDAYINTRQVQNAWVILRAADHLSVPITRDTLDIIARGISRSYVSIEKAFAYFRQNFKHSDKVNSDCYATIVGACVMRNQLFSAMAMLGISKKYDIHLSEPVFSYLIQGAEQNGYKRLADSLYKLLLQIGLEPSADILYCMIFVHLNGDNYQGAFKYWKELKTRKIVPPIQLYTAFIKHLIFFQDYENAKKTLDELKDAGYSDRYLHSKVFNSKTSDTLTVPNKGTSSQTLEIEDRLLSLLYKVVKENLNLEVKSLESDAFSSS